MLAVTRRRLKPEERRDELLYVGAEFFASRPYDDVLMEDIATRVGVSRALLYRYFPGKRELFAAIYRRAADRLLDTAQLDPDLPLAETVSAGLDAHIDYFEANRLTVLAAADGGRRPVHPGDYRRRTRRIARSHVDAGGFTGRERDVASVTLHAWLVFVREMCVGWLENGAVDRDEVHAVCLRTLFAGLGVDR